MQERKNILILGATGPSGVLTVRLAVERGHNVAIFARNPSKLPEDLRRHPNIKTVVGELTSTSLLFPLLPTTDTIISLLGPVSMRHRGTPLSDFYRALLTHVRTLDHPPRILALGTLSISSPLDHFSILSMLLVGIIWLLAHGAYNEFVCIADTFEKEGEGMPWTVFRVGYLSDAAGVGVGSAGYVGEGAWGVSMPKKDVAGWLIDEAEAEESRWDGKMPAIYSGTRDKNS